MRNRNNSIADRAPVMSEGELKTLKHLFEVADKYHRGKTAFQEAHKSVITCFSYERFLSDVSCFGTALMNLGLEGQHIAVLGENSYKWITAHFAVTCAGVSVPLDKELSIQDMVALLRKGDVTAMICTAKYTAKGREAAAEVPEITALIVDAEPAGPSEYSFEGLLSRGRELIEEGDRSWLGREVCPEDPAAIQFTSGTTGANKGVVMTHGNIAANVNHIARFFPVEKLAFSVLPINHTLECNTHIFPHIYFGDTVCFNSSLKRVSRNLKLFKPGMMIAVPMFLDEFYNTIWMNARREGKEKDLKKGIVISRICGAFGIDVRDKLFGDVFKTMGGNLKYIVCGGAPLNLKTARGLYDMGIDIAHGYGITECAPLVCVNLGRAGVMGSVGKVVPGVEVRIDSPDSFGNGEIWVRGDNVSPGYYKDEESNAASFQDGWFKTGDYGRFDWRGRLWISGRKKNLIILENGKNVFPEEIESQILSHMQYVRESVVFEAAVRNRGKKSTAIAAAVCVRDDGPEAELSDSALFDKVAEDIRRLNHLMTSYKRITRLYVTKEEFPKNATRKIIRKTVVRVNTEGI